MLVEPIRPAPPRSTPSLSAVDITTGSEAPRIGVVRRSRLTGQSTFRLPNGAEVELVGALGAYSGMYPPGHLADLRSVRTA